MPELVELSEVGVERGRVKHEKPGGLEGAIAERVGCTTWNEYPRSPRPDAIHTVQEKRDLTVEHVEAFIASPVAMRQWHPPAWWKFALHQRETTTGT